MTDTPTPPSWAEVPRATVRWSLARVDGDTTDVAVGDRVTLQPTVGGIAVVDPLGINPVSVILESRTYELRGDGALVDDQGDMASVLAVDDPRVATPGGRGVQWIARHERSNESVRFPAAAGETVELSRWAAAKAPEPTQRSWAEQLVDAAKDVAVAIDSADLSGFATTASLADVATSGAYADLTGTPAIPDSPDDIGAAPATHEHTAADIDSSAALDGHILTADGAGGAAWEAPPAGGGAPALRVPWAGYIDSGHQVARDAARMKTDATYLTPLFIKWDCNMTGLAIQVDAASTEAPTVGLVVYDSGADGLPLNRLALETVDVSTEGGKVASLAAPVPVSAGMCLWAGVVLSGGVAGLIIPYVTNNPSVGTPPSAVLDTPYNGTGWRAWRTAYGRGARTTTTPAVMAPGDFTLPEGPPVRYAAQVAVGVAP